MNVYRLRFILITIFLNYTGLSFGQSPGFDSFISRISKQYQVDLALAPELLPALDSIRNLGIENKNIEDLLHQLLEGTNISYQIIDGNKLMLRRESTSVHTPSASLITLKGMIVDGGDGSPLPFAAVTLKESTHGVFTDEHGYFTLPADDSTGTILVNYLGYKTMSIPVQSFMTDKKTVRMAMSAVPLKQVTIVVPFQPMHFNQDVQSLDLKGYQFFSSDELLNGNAEQLMNTLIGYTHFSSDQGIRLRGGDAENSLVLMDGLPVYDPYHFYNIFSAFNGHYFSSVKLYKNNMPVEYGGRIDGLISMDSDHHTPGNKLILDTDLLLSTLSADLDISDKVRFTAGGRLSHTGILNAALSDSTVSNFSNHKPGKFTAENEYSSSQQPTFDFFDINLGLRAQIADESNLQLAYFKNRDHLETNILSDFETTEYDNDIISVKQKIHNRDQWQNEGMAIDFQSPVLQGSTFNVKGFISSFEKSSTYASVSDEFQHHLHRLSANTGQQDSHLQTGGLKAFISRDLKSNAEYKFGLDLQRHEIALSAKENGKSYLSEKQQEFESTLFGEYRVGFFNKFEVTFGGRLTDLKSTGKVYVQPQVLLNYFPEDHLTIKASYSKNIQAIQQITLENRYGREIEFPALSQPETGFPVLKSDKYMVGAGYSSTRFNVDAEFYYKKLDGLINVRATRPDPGFHDHSDPGEFYRFFKGAGWTAGMDMFLAYKRKKFESTLSYTLSKITEHYDNLFKGKSFSPEEDRRHQIKLSANQKIGKFTLSSLLAYKSKAPYLSFIQVDGGDIGIGDPNQSFRFLPPYFSLDLGLDYSFHFFKQPAQFGISLINATNHENISDFQHIGMVSRNQDMGGPGSPLYLTQKTELLGRTFNVHFRYLIR